MIALVPALLVVGSLGTSQMMYERQLGDIAAQMMSSAAAQITADGIALTIDRQAFVMLPLPGATELFIDYLADSIFTVSFLSEAGHAGPPARYARIDPGPGTVRASFLTTDGWSVSSRPILRFEGTGHVVFRRVVSRPPEPSIEAAAASYDAARWTMPESVGPTTINVLTPPYIRSAPDSYLPDLLVFVALGVTIVSMVLLRNRPRGLRIALAAGGLVAFLGLDLHFMIARFLPILKPLELDPEKRIARNYYFAAELGELAALARRELPPSLRVGVLARDDDWFAPQTLCFNLMPRPCATMRPDHGEHVGIAGTPRLTTEELDAIVVYDAARPLPEGFVRTAQISDDAFVARRR